MPDKNSVLRLQYIIKKYSEGKASKEEVEFLNLYFDAFDQQPDYLETRTEEEKRELRTAMEGRILDPVLSNGSKKVKLMSLPVRNLMRAAAVLLFLLTGVVVFYLLRQNNRPPLAQSGVQLQKLQQDVAPGGNKAVLILADGSRVMLDSARNGALTKQGGVRIIKLDDGRLAYENTGNENSTRKEIFYNTVSTPRGGQYQLVLSDSSRVWLNAASSLRFPATFSGSDRTVELTGEGYFEVAKDRTRPFKVIISSAAEGAKQTTIEVLGTHFNINAYEDEHSVKTTLLEGAVKVSKGTVSTLIMPGEQARVSPEADEINVKRNVDLEEVVAWKNGKFQFDQAGIKTIMRQIARWYNVEVVFEDGLPNKKFDGKIYRNVNASEVFKILEAGGIHIRIDGKKVIVSP